MSNRLTNFVEKGYTRHISGVSESGKYTQTCKKQTKNMAQSIVRNKLKSKEEKL